MLGCNENMLTTQPTLHYKHDMSLQSYFQKLQQEHNVTCFEFVTDQSKGNGRKRVSRRFPTSKRDVDTQVVRQRPTFQTDSERLSSAPKCPLRTPDDDEFLLALYQIEEALDKMNLSLTDIGNKLAQSNEDISPQSLLRDLDNQTWQQSISMPSS